MPCSCGAASSACPSSWLDGLQCPHLWLPALFCCVTQDHNCWSKSSSRWGLTPREILCFLVPSQAVAEPSLMHCRISIDGHTEISFTEDVNARFEALGWHVQHVKDGNTDLSAMRNAIEAAKKDPRPSMIKVGVPLHPSVWVLPMDICACDICAIHQLWPCCCLAVLDPLCVDTGMLPIACRCCMGLEDNYRALLVAILCTAKDTQAERQEVEQGVRCAGVHPDRVWLPQQGRHARRARRAPRQG